MAKSKTVAKKVISKKVTNKKAANKKVVKKKPRRGTAEPHLGAPPSKKTCFVIMPFGRPFDAYYERIYKPAIEQAGLEPHRADDLYRPSTIVNDIWAYTTGSRLLLADLTGKNPNVFYELGLAHALAKPAILVAQSMDDIPFDLRSLRIIIYNKDDPSWGDDLQQSIVKSIGEVLEAPNEAVLPTFLAVRPERNTVTPHQKELLDIKRDLDLLRSELRSNNLNDRGPDIFAPSHTLSGPDEARKLLRSLLRRGLDDETIINVVVQSGAPRTWTKETLGEMRARERKAIPRVPSARDLPGTDTVATVERNPPKSSQ